LNDTNKIRFWWSKWSSIFQIKSE